MRHFTLLTGLMFSGTALADDMVKRAASDFEVPSFSSQQLSIEGQDLLAITGTPEGTTAEGQLAVAYTKVEQTPERTLTIGESATIYGTTDGPYSLSFAAENVAAVQSQRYLYGSRGLGLTGALAGGMARVADQDAIADIYTAGAVSYGRIIDAKTLAQAQAMFGVLDREPTIEQLVTVADLIGKRSAYTADYQYDADIYFYQDIADALGGASLEEVYKVQQVLDSPLYNIGSRITGWTAGVRLEAGSGDLLGDNGMAAALSQYAAYATLLGDGASLTVSETISHGISDTGIVQELTPPISTAVGSTVLTLSSSISVDHSTSWNSGAGFSFVATGGIPEEDAAEGDETPSTSADWTFTAESNIAIGSRLVSGAEFVAGQTVGMDDLNWGFNFRITYFVL